MELTALDPLSLGTVSWRTEAGAENLTVIVKATFELVHDQAARLVEPYPLFGDLHYEDNEERSLRVASDLAVRKPRADVLFTGAVYAPIGQRITRREVRLAVLGEGGAPVVDKTIVAVGARDRDETGKTTEPAPFGYLPLRYELAYGGPQSKSNPIGVGTDPTDPRMPSLVHPENAKLVAGFGPVPRSWWWRKRALAGADPALLQVESPTVPAAIDLAYYNAAPPDQQVPYLRGDETIVLVGLHPTMAQIKSRLPGLRAHARVDGREVKLALDTLWIEGETLRCTLTWRGFVDASQPAAAVMATLARGDAAPDWTPRRAEVPAPPPPPIVAPPPVTAPGAPPAPPPMYAAPPKKPKRGIADKSTTSIELELERPPVAAPKTPDKPKPPPRVKPNVPIVNTTKLVAWTTPWQVKPPEDSLVVIVKGTFTLTGDDVKLAEEQDPPSGDVPYDDAEGDAPAIKYASDFAIFKPAADVLLVGHAHAPEAQKGVAHVDLRFGDVRRRFAVFGDRRWGAEDKPLAFEKMPLRWERAMGGPLSEANPVGRGFKSGVLLPNVERVEKLVRTKDDRPPPACPGPVPSMWKARRDKLGTYDAKWLKARWPYFPADFDWSYFNAAPPEQQVPYLRGDEVFSIGGVRPKGAMLTGKLPDLRPRVFAQRTAEGGGDFFEVTLRLDTAYVDADAMKLVLVWRGLFATRDEDAPEIAAVFVTEDTYKKPLGVEDAQKRFFAEVATAQLVPPSMLKFADEPEKKDANAPPPPPPMPRADVEALAKAKKLAARDLTGADLSDMDLAGADLSAAILSGAKLFGAKLAGAKLGGAILTHASLEDANLEGADLAQADLTGAKLGGANFTRANLGRALLDGARANGAIFVEAKLDGASVQGAALRAAKLDGASLVEADLTGADLDGATFKGAKMDDARLYGARGERVTFEKASMNGARCDGAALPRAVFAGTTAEKSVWDSADLSGATFHEAKLSGAMFTRTKLEDAVLSKATAVGALFRRAKLARARCLRANLMQAGFERADLTGADLRGANLYQAETWRAKTEGVDLAQAIVAGTKLAK